MFSNILPRVFFIDIQFSRLRAQAIKIVAKKVKIWFLSISIGHNITSTHDKATLIIYLYTQGGLLLHVIHKLPGDQSIR